MDILKTLQKHLSDVETSDLLGFFYRIGFKIACFHIAQMLVNDQFYLKVFYGYFKNSSKAFGRC